MEHGECIINEKKSNYKMTIPEFNSDNIITNEFMKDKEHELANLLGYDKQERFLNKNMESAKKDVNELDPIHYGYVEHAKEIFECNFYYNVNDEFKILTIIIPIVFVITTLCIIIIYCKYRVVRNSYERLREEVEPSTQNSNPIKNS